MFSSAAMLRLLYLLLMYGGVLYMLILSIALALTEFCVVHQAVTCLNTVVLNASDFVIAGLFYG